MMFVTSSYTAAAPAKLPARLDLSTHPTGSAANAIAMGFGKVASEKGPIMVVVAPTNGPLAWVGQMSETGNPALGNCNSLDLFWIYFNDVAPVSVPDNMLGDKPFYPKAFKNLRLIASGGRMATGFLVLDKSPYKKIQDLKGARLASGYRAQPSAFSPMIADLMNVGMTLKDFREVAVTNPGAGILALGEGRVDTVHCGTGMSQTAEVDSKEKLRYLPASPDPAGIKRAQSLIPGATYPEWAPGFSAVRQQLGSSKLALQEIRTALAQISDPEEVYYRVGTLFATCIVAPDEAESLATSLAAWASAHQRFGLALAGHVRAARAALAQRAVLRALPHVEAALRLGAEYQPDSFYLPEMWLVAGRVYAAAGHTSEAVRAVDEGATWVRRAAQNDVPEPIAARADDRGAAIGPDTEETERRTRRAARVDGDVEAAIGGVLESGPCG